MPQSDPADVKELNLTIDLCLRVGEMLLSNGAGAADVTSTMRAVAQHLGMRNTDIDVTFTQISMSHQHDPAEPTLVMIRQVPQRTIDYEDLTQVDHLVRDLLAGRLDLYLARTRMATIVSVAPPFPRWMVTVASGVMCAAVGVFLGVGWIGAVIAFLAAASIDRIQHALTRQRIPNFYQQIVGGFVASGFAVGATAAGLPVDSSLVITANIIMLLAGIGFMGALQDAISGFYLTGTARITEAMMATAGIVAGVSGGLSLAHVLGIDMGHVDPGRSGLEELGLFVAGSALSAAAFAVTAYSPWRVLAPVAFVAGVAAATHRLVTETGFDGPWAAALAAFVIGLVAYSVAGRVRVPPLVVVVPAIVPLLPGLSIYRGLSLLLEGGSETSSGLLALVTAGSVALALAGGVILGEYVAQPVKREARRLEQRLAGPRLVGVSRPSTRHERRQRRAEERDRRRVGRQGMKQRIEHRMEQRAMESEDGERLHERAEEAAGGEA